MVKNTKTICPHCGQEKRSDSLKTHQAVC